MFVKVCGLRTAADVAAAVAAGADGIGLVFADSPRQVTAGTARQLVAGVPPHVLTVGVFRDIAAADAGRIAMDAGVGAVQLHGPYPREAFAELATLPVRLIRATPLADGTELQVGACGEDMLLLDSPVPGSGQTWDLSALGPAAPQGRWLLAGGLTPANVAAAIAEARPWGVDVSSGVESSRGIKDHDLVRQFISAAKGATAGLAPEPSRGGAGARTGSRAGTQNR